MAPSHLSELRLSIFGVTTLVVGFLIFVANNNTWTSNKKSAVYISRVKTKAPYLSEILNKKDVDKNNQNKKLSSPWPNKVYNKWVNRSGIEYETYFDTGECKDAYRLPKDIKKLLHTRDFPLFMAERTKFTVEGSCLSMLSYIINFRFFLRLPQGVYTCKALGIQHDV